MQQEHRSGLELVELYLDLQCTGVPVSACKSVCVGCPLGCPPVSDDHRDHRPHRLGTLRMFFVRLDEWGWDDAPPRVPMFPGDLPRQDHPLPKALDDASAAKLLRAA